jgi:hypothetical protein
MSLDYVKPWMDSSIRQPACCVLADRGERSGVCNSRHAGVVQPSAAQIDSRVGRGYPAAVREAGRTPSPRTEDAMSGTPIGHAERAPLPAILFGSRSWPGPAAVLAALVLACWPLAAQVPPLAVDIVVLDGAGKVPDSLAPSDLAVTLGGQARSVLWVRRVSRGPGALADAAVRRATGQPGTAYVAEPSRTVIVAVDERSLPAGGERLAIQVATALLDRLGMNDRVAVVRLPLMSDPALALTTERPVIRDAIGRIAGRLGIEERPTDGITPSWRHVGRDLIEPPRNSTEPERPTPAVRADVPDGSAAGEEDTLGGLLRTFTALSKLPGRKTVAFISTGLDDKAAPRIMAAARAAADARASLYVFDLRAAAGGRGPAADAGLLVRLAQAAGGVSIVPGRNPAKDIEVLMPELLACFQVGLEREDGDVRAADSPLRVLARRAGLVVRAPSFVGLRAPAAEDVEPPPAPRPAAVQPERPQSYHGGGRVQPASPPVPGSSARSPELEMLLGKLSDYVQAYTGHYSALVAEESYHQSVPLERRQRRLRSDLLFIRSEPSAEWVSFRDVFEVDGRPVRDRELRLEKLFLAPAPEARARLEAIRDESARYNLSPIVRNINVPLYPLKILLPENLARFVFSLGQAAQVDGTKVRSVRFTEVGRPALVRDLEGHDVPLQGRFLVEPATGAIIESTVSAGLTTYFASIVVRYARNAKMGLWVPAEMKERYSAVVQGGTMRQTGESLLEATARYSNFRRFQVSTEEKVVVPK